MDTRQACRILAISGDEDWLVIKKAYRQLMRMVHPDNGNEALKKYEFSAQEINAAYTYLLKNVKIYNKKTNKEPTKKQWDAKINEKAFSKRIIYDEVTDANRNVIGVIEIAEGKYYWSIEEEFSLFLKSIYERSKRLLDTIDINQNRTTRNKFEEYQAELTYLLASQYIDGLDALYQLNLDIENEEESEIFYIAAMIEPPSTNVVDGMKIYPAVMKNHRLYVADANKNSLGYLSFDDDRISFILIPLLEQGGVQVKMNISQSGEWMNHHGRRYKNVDLWVKTCAKQEITGSDNVNLKIGELLNRYEKEL